MTGRGLRPGRGYLEAVRFALSPFDSWVSDLSQAADVTRPASKRPGSEGTYSSRAPATLARAVDGSTPMGSPPPIAKSEQLQLEPGGGKRLISLMEKRLNKSNPKPTLANQLTCNWRLCEGGLGRARLPGREGRWGVRRGKRSKCQIREDERRGRKNGARLQRGEVGRHGDSTGGQVTRVRGERQARGGQREQDARAPPGTRSPCSHPSPPGIPPRPNSTCGADGGGGAHGRGGEGWGGAGTKELSAPYRAVRAAHLAPGSRHLLQAHRLLD